MDGKKGRGEWGAGEEAAMDKPPAENIWVAKWRQGSGRERHSEPKTDYDKCHSIIA